MPVFKLETVGFQFALKVGFERRITFRIPLAIKRRTAALMQVSRTPRTKFMWYTVVRGVGEALKREIAGMVLVGQPGLWGFEDGGCFGFGWE
jgi:hypothetical protein